MLIDKSTLSPKRISQMTGFRDPRYFNRIFKQVTGHTPKTVRMHEAKRMLYNSPLPIQLIAERVGHESIYAFSAQFKRSTGLSPTEYRQNQTTK